MNKHKFNVHPNRPWYYVPGKTYLSEQRLATKLENESQKQKKNEKLNKYYSKCNQQTKLYSNWEQNKHLVKYKEMISEPPFLIEKDKEQIQIDQNHYEESLAIIEKHLNEYKIAATEFKNSFIDSSAAVQYLLKQIELYEEVKKMRENFFTNWKQYLNDNAYNYINDPLRHVCFQIRELLYFYKSLITDNLKRLKEIYVNNFFSKTEQDELETLNQRCVQIIDMYLNLNELRNKHFQNMYYEERESNWYKQKPLWSEEMEVWDNLFIKIFDSNYQIIRNRIEELSEKHRAMMKNRIVKLEKLKQLIDEFKKDEQLRPILYQNIEQFNKFNYSC